MAGLQAYIAFAETVKRGGFAGAARELGLSPSAVAKSITRLEAGLGVRLFHRTTRTVALTSEGHELAERCRRIVEEVEALRDQAAGTRAEPSGTLRLNVPITFGKRVLVPKLAELVLRHPAITLDVGFSDRYADLVSELLWRPMGAGHSAYITVDRLGAPRCAGGVCATARDLARVGQLLVEGGRRIVPESWIDDIAAHGDPQAWAAGSFAAYYPGAAMHYRDKWYVLRGAAPLLFGMGVHGQNLYVDRALQLVVAKFSSQAQPIDAHRIALTTRAVERLRQQFAGAAGESSSAWTSASRSPTTCAAPPSSATRAHACRSSRCA